MNRPQPNHPHITGKLILLAQSARWRTAIAKLDLPCDLIHAIDVDDLMTEAKSHFGSVAAIELTPKKIGPLCQAVAQIANAPSQLRLVALGSPACADWNPLVQLASFAEAYFSTTDLNRLPPLIKNHFRSIQWPKLTLEQQFESRLPWPPSRNAQSKQAP